MSPARSSPASGPVPPTTTVGGTRWRALTNHARVLVYLDQCPEARVRDIADDLGLTERFVARVIDELERDGFLVRERAGRRNRYTVKRDRPVPDLPVTVSVAALVDSSIDVPAVDTDGDERPHLVHTA